MEPGSSRKRKREEDGAKNAASKDSANESEAARSSSDSQTNFVRGEKQFLFDDAGQRYLDLMSSAQHVGHCHKTVVAAAARQMAELNTNTRFLNDRMITFSQRLTSTLPDRLSKCIFVNSRSEANDLALRISESVTGHSHCISLTGCYHGHLQWLRSLTGDYPSSDCSQAPTPDVYRGRFRDLDTAGRQYAEEVQKVIDQQLAQGKTISCFIHESVMTHAGMVQLPGEFLSTVYRSVREAGGMCIADEAECGLGRLGEKFWGFEVHGVCPDIVTIGEAVGNGHPVGAVVTTTEIADKFAQAPYYFNTFGGNPVSMAIAGAVLEVVEEERLQENARAVGAFLLDQLRQLRQRHCCMGDVRGAGLCVGVELVTERESREPAVEKAREVVTRLLREHKIAAEVDGVRGNVIRVKPPMCITMENAKELVSALDAILLS